MKTRQLRIARSRAPPRTKFPRDTPQSFVYLPRHRVAALLFLLLPLLLLRYLPLLFFLLLSDLYFECIPLRLRRNIYRRIRNPLVFRRPHLRTLRRLKYDPNCDCNSFCSSFSDDVSARARRRHRSLPIFLSKPNRKNASSRKVCLSEKRPRTPIRLDSFRRKRLGHLSRTQKSSQQTMRMRMMSPNLLLPALNYYYYYRAKATTKKDWKQL